MRRLNFTVRTWFSGTNGIVAASLLIVVLLALALRLSIPLRDPSIGEIDVYFWGIRTEQFELFGLSQASPFWVLPVFMSALHRITGASLYTLFLWTGPIISGSLVTVIMYFLGREFSRSHTAGILSALIYAITPVVFYRGTFTVSETLAYVFIPLSLYLSLRLYRRRTIGNYIALGTVLLLALFTHDSAKLLFLPAVLASVFFFITIAKKRWGIFVMAGTALLAGFFLYTHPAIINEVLFFLFPLSHQGNSAFGAYPIIPWSAYTSAFPAMLSWLTLLGLLLFLIFKKRERVAIAILLLFVVPIVYYQQIQPRLFGSTIVPFRLTPLLTFVIVPLAAAGIGTLLRLFRRRFAVAACMLALVMTPPLLAYAVPVTYPLDFITSVSEQESLRQLPLSQKDFVITPNGLLGMAGMATTTSEQNYYPDTTGAILAAPDQATAVARVRSVEAQTGRKLTGILISKWKLEHYDPFFGWWDSLVIPQTNVDLFRTRDFPVRYEDDNLVLFGLRNGL